VKKRQFILFATGAFGLVMMLTACNGSPMAPSGPTGPASTVATTPEPAPAPTAPEPAPAPVPPVPPVPAPDAVWAAEVQSGDALPGHFEVKRFGARLEIPGHGFDIILETPSTVYSNAGPTDVFVIRGGSMFEYSGRAGFVVGTLVRVH
jgi:hypothetical protein